MGKNRAKVVLHDGKEVIEHIRYTMRHNKKGLELLYTQETKGPWIARAYREGIEYGVLAEATPTGKHVALDIYAGIEWAYERSPNRDWDLGDKRDFNAREFVSENHTLLGKLEAEIKRLEGLGYQGTLHTEPRIIGFGKSIKPFSFARDNHRRGSYTYDIGCGGFTATYSFPQVEHGSVGRILNDFLLPKRN